MKRDSNVKGISLLDYMSSMTYSFSKLTLEMINQHGGKIADQANAIGNAMDT